MRTITVAEELTEAGEILRIAGIKLEINDDASLQDIPDLTQNIISICIKGAVTNVVKHSQAAYCRVTIERLEASK